MDEAMGYTRSVDAEIAVAGVTVIVTSWDWSDPFSGIHHLPEDHLSLHLTPQVPNSQLWLGGSHNRGTPVTTGSLGFWPEGTRIYGRNAGGHTRAVTCAFHGSWFRDLTGLHEMDSLSACPDLKNKQLLDAMSRLGQEALAPGFGSEQMVEGLTLQVAIELARHLRNLSTRANEARQTLTPWQMKRVARYIESFSGYIPDFDEIAELCGISSRHFRRLFKETTDQTLHDYARDIWAEKAKAALRDTRLPLKQVWSQFGFPDSSCFAVAFRRATGHSPTSYRRQFQSSGGERMSLSL